MTTKTKAPEPKRGRSSLGHTEQMMLKLHPDLLAYVAERAAENYTSGAEYVRQLIIADMRTE